MPIPSHLSRLAGPTLRMQPDSRLVELVREGHERAFEEIVRRYRGPLTGFAGTIVPSHGAEDVVQESFAKALEAIRRDDREIALKAWLYTIVRNRALNGLRDEPVHEQINPQHDGVPQPPEIAARRAEVASLLVGLKDLPESQREAIVQRELSGYGHEQIGRNLGVTPGAVRQLIFRARCTLREGFGVMIPLPVLRQILESAARAGSSDAAILGGGGALGFKVGVALLATGAAVSGGAVIQGHDGDPAAVRAFAAVAPKEPHGSGHRSSTGPGVEQASTPKHEVAAAHNSEPGDRVGGDQRSSGGRPSGPLSGPGDDQSSGGETGSSGHTPSGDGGGSDSGSGGAGSGDGGGDDSSRPSGDQEPDRSGPSSDVSGSESSGSDDTGGGGPAESSSSDDSDPESTSAVPGPSGDVAGIDVALESDHSGHGG